MPAFEYKAVDQRGRRQKGVLEADSHRHVRQLLRDQGLTPLDTAEVGLQGQGSGAGWGAARMGAADLALFTRQLATLLRAGAPLEEALGNIARHQRKRGVKRVVVGIRARVVEGYSLARSLGEFPQVFNELFRATVEAGEETGHIDPVLERLADYTEARQAMRQKLQAAMIYPVILSVVALLVLAGLLVYVVPAVVQVFESMQQELPWLTRALLDVSAFLQAWWWAIIAGVLLAVFAWRQAIKGALFRERMDRLALGLPLFGTLYRGVNAARFARTLSILAGSGVPILKALEIAGRVIPCLPMRRAVAVTASRVREGGMMWKSLEDSGQFPPMMVYLIANGETSGELEALLEKAAEQQERETDSTLGTALALFEPLLILSMGGLVMLIVLAILLPIFELNQLVAV